VNKQRPSALAMITMVAFTASCIGLLIFLWISFGGSLPFNAQGYRFSVEFNQATELASNAEVEIAGVKVGHVVSVKLDRRTGLERAVLEIDRRYAPRPADTRAILRQKTLLGETYVQLSAGDPKTAKLRDGGSLPRAQVAPTVQLDQILNSFNPKTRRAFETWMQQGGVALTNRGEQFNAALAQLYPFATNVDTVLAVLRRQGVATRTLLGDGGQVFSALSQSPAQLQSFVRNTDATFAATAARDQDLAATIQNFPALLRQARVTLDRVGSFARTTKPLVDELHPTAVRLTPALQKLETLSPELKTLMTDVGPLSSAAKTGLPSLRRFLNESVPFLKAVKPYLGQLVPVINYLDVYRRDLAGFFANSAAATEGQAARSGGSGGNLHYLRLSSPINPEALATYSKRPSSNRSNAYLKPGGYAKLLAGLPVFGTYLCTDNPLPSISPDLSELGSGTTSVAGAVLTVAQLVQQYYYTANPAGPACKAQGSLGKSTTGQTQSFPSLKALP
jgi:phospholipid/cholesterol/gamma-HCH transport system substrate-binding protein